MNECNNVKVDVAEADENIMYEGMAYAFGIAMYFVGLILTSIVASLLCNYIIGVYSFLIYICICAAGLLLNLKLVDWLCIPHRSTVAVVAMISLILGCASAAGAVCSSISGENFREESDAAYAAKENEERAHKDWLKQQIEKGSITVDMDYWDLQEFLNE